MKDLKRQPKLLYGAALLFLFWLGDWMGTAYSEASGSLAEKLAAAADIGALLLHPLRLSLRPLPFCCGLCACGGAALVWLCIRLGRHRLMPQQEYGSARWGTAEDIANFVDEDPNRNLPLTVTESLSLAPRMKVTVDDNYNRNKNLLVIGASGSGKSRNVAKPEILQFNSNYVITDPKAELLTDCGAAFLSQGYALKVLNLKDPKLSDHYNFFAYLKDENDILEITKNLIRNLKDDPNAQTSSDPIWEEGMTALLEALIGYVMYELPEEERNMNSVMTLFNLLEVQEGVPNYVSRLDVIFDDLAMKKPKAFSCRQYHIYKMSAAKTAQSINVSLGLRLAAFNLPDIAEIVSEDTINLRELGEDKKVALFIVLPDTTKAFNFLAAVMYQQLFSTLCRLADSLPGKRLPRHCRFLLDEFPNTGYIPNFDILISTIRSRDIAVTIIYQSLAQLKNQYKDNWTTIFENCDSFLFLGGSSNPENLEFISKMLGKSTIEVMNTSESKGGQGSYTKSYQALGRELMTLEEIRTLKRGWCLLVISGVPPFLSRKYDVTSHPNYHLLADADPANTYSEEKRRQAEAASFVSDIKTVRTVEIADTINNL